MSHNANNSTIPTAIQSFLDELHSQGYKFQLHSSGSFGSLEIEPKSGITISKATSPTWSNVKEYILTELNGETCEIHPIKLNERIRAQKLIEETAKAEPSLQRSSLLKSLSHHLSLNDGAPESPSNDGPSPTNPK